jgi:hypothetical protein
VNPAALLALLVVVAGGCRKKLRGDDANLVAEWRDAVCACKDMACVTKAGEEITKRATASKHSGHGEVDNAAVAAAQKCLETIARADQPAEQPSEKARTADALIASVRRWQKNARMSISNISVEYVDSAGVLDKDYGRLSVSYGLLTRPPDDPNRKTGIPVKFEETPVTCDSLTFKTSWTVDRNAFCPDEQPHPVQCSVAQIWQHAIAQKAPPDAVAVIAYRNVEPPTWSFQIRDEPRAVNVDLSFPDDCEHVVEKP